ncbi:uncharacterized protein N7515_000099 [Penicillium bovifimosum]|uniref:Calcineurin-like phosphoesterase domain-containing protein n=1 Tax=Penicillium bovifimosum TaxID=126998 RepID=A0A9W9HES4_9EURO|nr:uncharacterized protein N7515_000099 [Penicillium bovifimosum]KAJ5145535.1 hypothetical protein N7515_000099 [Penicillium bovifimosum]
MPARRSWKPYKKSTEEQKLRFDKDNRFQITVFGDLHFAEDDKADKKTTGVMKNVLSSEKTDLVVLNGDLISGDVTKRSNSTRYIDQIVAPLVDHGLPWASAYGNHDSEIHLDSEELLREEKKHPGCLTQRSVSGSTAGVTNYYLPVFPHETSNLNQSIPELILWFFDSQGGHFPMAEDDHGESVPRQNWVDRTVVEWFTKANDNLTTAYGKTIPSLAFTHIPVQAMRAFQNSGVNPTHQPGIDAEKVHHQGGDLPSGYRSQDFPFMQALLNTSGLAAVFSGHDHGNDWCFRWDDRLAGMNLTGSGVNLCYGRRTGYGGYGEWARGARQILVDENSLRGDIRTWIRLEDGSKSGDVHLNSTYGSDQYAIRGQGSAFSSQYLGFVYLWMVVILGLSSGFGD